MLRNHVPLFLPNRFAPLSAHNELTKLHALASSGEDRTLVNLLLEETDPLMEQTRCPLMDSRIVPMMSG